MEPHSLPDVRTRVAPTAICRASAQVTQVFGTHRVRDHPAHAARRRDCLSLDDRGAVPQRCRPGPGHPRACGPDRGRRRLCRGRRGRRPPCRADRLRPVVRVRAPRRPRFGRIQENGTVGSFRTGAGPAVIGAIAGSAIPLGLSLQYLWQIPVLAGAVLWFFAARRGVVSGLLAAGATGVAVALAGIPPDLTPGRAVARDAQRARAGGPVCRSHGLRELPRQDEPHVLLRAPDMRGRPSGSRAGWAA